MEGFFSAVSAVVIIFLVMSVGWVLGQLGWLTKGEKRFLSNYVVNIAVPSNCIVGVLSSFSRDTLAQSGINLLVGVTVVFLSLLLGCAVATLLKLPKNRWGIFVSMVGVSNSMFVGLPVVQQLFDSAGVPYHMYYFLASSMFTQTVVVMLCERAGRGGGETDLGRMVLGIFKKPPVLGILISVTLLLLNVRLPRLIMSTLGYIGDTVTPLALIYCGFILWEVGLKNLRFLPGLPVMLVIRLLIAPLLAMVVCHVLGVEGLARQVFVVLAGMPVLSQVTVMAGAYGADEEYAAVGSCLSMLGMFITLPLLMVIVL